MGRIKSAYNWMGTNHWVMWDATTHETLLTDYPIKWYDEFITDAMIKASGKPGWTTKITGAAPPTAILVADQHGGVYSLNLTSASQKQEAGIYFNDELVLNLDKGPIVEIRAAVHTTPTDKAEIYFGVANDYVEGPIVEADAGPTVHAFFVFDASLTCTIHTDDASTDNDAVATGITVVEDIFHIYRIDFSTITNVKFYIDGARVGAATTCSMAYSSNVMVQPFLICHKESGTGVGSLYIDYIKYWSAR